MAALRIRRLRTQKYVAPLCRSYTLYRIFTCPSEKPSSEHLLSVPSFIELKANSLHHKNANMPSDDYAGGSVVAATVFGLLLPISAMAIRVWVKSRTEFSLALRPEEIFSRAALVSLGTRE